MQYKAKINESVVNVLDAVADEKRREAQRERYRRAAAKKRRLKQIQRKDQTPRDAEEERRRSEELQGRSGSRYSDKQPKQVPDGRKPKHRKGPALSKNTTQPNLQTEAAAESQTAEMAETGQQKKTVPVFSAWKEAILRKDPLAIAAAVLLSVFFIGYIAAAVFFRSHFYDETFIYGIDCSRMTVEEAKAAVVEKVNHYDLTVTEKDGQEKITASQIGLIFDDQGSVEKLLSAQNSWIWPVMLLPGSSTTAMVDTEYDLLKTVETIDRLTAMDLKTAQKPVDAYVGETDTGFVVVPEEEGAWLNRKMVQDLVLDALENGISEVSLLECYEEPAVRSDDPELNKQAEEMNALLGAEITYDFQDRKVVIDTPAIMQLITEDEEGGYKIDDDLLWSVVDKMAYDFDTLGCHRTFHTSLGGTVELYGGDYGWVIDQNETFWQLHEAIRLKEVETIEPIYTYTAKSRGRNDIGGTYVEISISTQQMWCYVDGYLLVNTPVVTGNPNRGNATPSGGVWSLDNKCRNQELVGEGYRAPVDYWMPFNGNIGIHDLQSRYAFGGDIYLYAGSHGCVNTPLDAVQLIYENISIGTPVIVYD